MTYALYTQERAQQLATKITQEWFDRMHDRASDNLAGDDWGDERHDLTDQIYIGGYCLDNVTA